MPVVVALAIVHAVVHRVGVGKTVESILAMAHGDDGGRRHETKRGEDREQYCRA